MSKPTTSIELIAPGCTAEEVACSGSLNGWSTTTGVVRLRRKSPGVYTAKAPWTGQSVEYKYHLGSWGTEELNEWGNRRTNRHYAGEGKVYDVVPGFLCDNRNYDEAFLPRIEPLPYNLPMPADFATRRIAALLPYDYDRCQREYPVIYLQDGQNLFDEFAPFGNWELDKRMAWLAERGWGDFIVVAIDHAAEKRILEYAPSHKTRIAKGQIEAYGAFLVDHLKPLIDRTYRTRPERQSTAIGGSSLGGLASLLVTMAYPQVFAKAMLLSPSIWVDPHLPSAWPDHTYGDSTVFLYGGMQESKGSLATFSALYRDLLAVHHPKRRLRVHAQFDPLGLHNETAWGAIFPQAITTLFR